MRTQEEIMAALMAMLVHADSPAVIMAEESLIRQLVTSADITVIGLTESGNAVEVDISVLGSVLVASVRYLGPTYAAQTLNTVRGAAYLEVIRSVLLAMRTVLYLGTVREAIVI